MSKREDYQKAQEQKAQQALDHLARRWPTQPSVYYVLLLFVVVLTLLYVLW